ncbi:MAG: MBL fold metallo-hydrolase [Clostridiales bacterium]|nr:MBL fold metallo-hydrolase [Clostridiales bacterium]
MKLWFLGTGAAEGVPAVYCQCPVCSEIRKRGESEYHTRSQLLIDEKVGIDYPPDAYYHSLRFGVELSKLRYLLITHSHMDHFYAHDFILRGYKYCSPVDKPLEIYGNAEVKRVFDECTKRELREEVAKTISVKEVQPFVPFSFGEKNEYTATALPAQHSKTEQAYVYLLEKGKKTYLHLCDTGRIDETLFAYLQTYLSKKGKTVDFVTFDCTFLFHTAGNISRHMGLEDNRATQEEMLRRKIVNEGTVYAITHYSHNNSPLKENLERAKKEYGYLPAYDGMEIEI